MSKLKNALVSYFRLGKWVTRSLPKKTKQNKIGSVRQNHYRSKFKKANLFLKPIKYVIRMGYKELSDKRNLTGHNLAMSHLLKNCFNEQGEINFSRFYISQGSLPPLSPVSLILHDEEIELQWDPKDPINAGRDLDRLLIAIYDPEIAEVLFQGTSVKRMDAKVKFSLNNSPEKNTKYQVWVACINDTQKLVSTSQYLGAF